MKYVRIIDENGLFLEDGFVEELTQFTIETPCNVGFHRPKWDGLQWGEGLTDEEIIKNMPTTNILTKYQFISRLTVQERIAIFELENTNPMVKMWLEMFKICDEIDLSNEETIGGIGMLSQLGILAEERISELLKPL